MTPEQAAALRAKFKPSQIGQLPKPTVKDAPKGRCPECGGWHGLPAVHLDYVGHAAVTDRLLAVDPEWSWEPLAYDATTGLPSFDPGRNLWIKLTVAGVTRLGVGDGASMKECIGDAIRNAAMRFGVALDLWAKEDLDGTGEIRPTVALADEPTERPATRTVSRQPQPSTGAPNLMTEPQSKKLHASFRDAGKDRDAGLAFVASVVGHPVTSTKELTRSEASRVIDRLESITADRAAAADEAGAA